MARWMLAACLFASLGGCSTQTSPSCAAGIGAPTAIFTLFLGKAIPGRADLTNKEWQAFLDTTVTAHLPNGYTVLDANGGWMNPVTHMTINEGTKVLVAALPDVPGSLAVVNRVRSAYQIKFHQQLVGMTVEHACAVF